MLLLYACGAFESVPAVFLASFLGWDRVTAQGHPVGFLPNIGLKLTVSLFLALTTMPDLLSKCYFVYLWPALCTEGYLSQLTKE